MEVPKAELPPESSVAQNVLSLPGARRGQGTLRQARPCPQLTSLQLRPAASEQLSHGEKKEFSCRKTRASVSITQPLLLLCCVTRASLKLSTCSFFIYG